jgi:hypothetical protein
VQCVGGSEELLLQNLPTKKIYNKFLNKFIAPRARHYEHSEHLSTEEEG